MATKGPETRLVRAITKAVAGAWHECWGMKVHGSPYQPPGVPDLLFCIRGRFVAMEVKAPQPGETVEHARGRASLQQLAQIARIQRAGGAAGVVCSVEEALDLVRGALETHHD